MNQGASRPFTRSQAQEFKNSQGVIVKIEASEDFRKTPMGVYNIVQVESKEEDKESKEKLANKDQIEAAGSEHIMIVKIAEIRW